MTGSDPRRTRDGGLTRRGLIKGAACMVAGARLTASAARAAAAQLPSGNWGAVRQIGDSVWAVASTPLAHRDFKTVCNGGIVAGSERVLVVEAFAGRPGAQWVAEAALELTGRWPSDVVLSHYHGDHTGGITGFLKDGERPTLHATRATLDRLAGGDENVEARERQAMISSAQIVAEDKATRIDLGGATAELHPYRGHTASDLVVDLADRGLAFAGDLLWNGMIPNFVDARPIELSRTLDSMRSLGARDYVPGHGALAEPRVLELNATLAGFFEETARRSHEAGVTAAEAAAEARLPTPFDSWVAFSESYVERAIAAWHRDLAAAAQ